MPPQTTTQTTMQTMNFMDKVIHFSIHNKLIIGLATLALVLWGGVSLLRLPIDAVPDITNNQVQVITVSPSLGAPDIERLVTAPAERVLSTIPQIVELRSFSRFGLSLITVVFTDETDVYWARQQVFERLQQIRAELPAGIGQPELAPVTTGLGEIYQYTLRVKSGFEGKYSLAELRTIQDWQVRRQLLGTKGVADVSSFGGYVKQYEIAIHPDRLRAMNTSIDELFAALERNNQNTGGAFIDKRPNAYFIRSEGLVTSAKDIEAIPVRINPNGTPVLVRDVAQVQFGHATRYGAITRTALATATAAGGREHPAIESSESVGAVVMMLKGENSSEVIASVKKRVEEINATLPEGVEIEAFLDRTKLVNAAITTVATNLAEGAIIVIAVLTLLLGNLRAGFVVASVIPLAMLFAVGMMKAFGVAGSLMSLGAIDFGLIVDGAVIIVEATMHHLVSHSNAVQRSLTRSEMNTEVYTAASQIRHSAAFGEIIILIVYLPILALTGTEGKMFKPMAQTVVFAITGAFVLSLTYVPMMSALLLTAAPKHDGRRPLGERVVDACTRAFMPLLEWCLRHKARILLASTALFVGAALLFFRLGGEFLPTLDEGDFAVQTRVLVGSSMQETVDASLKGAKILVEQFPEVERVVGKTGSGEIPTDPMPPEECDLMVILKPRATWTSAHSREELAEKMSDALKDIAGVTFGFQQPIQMRFNELMTGARQDVVIKIYGDDLEVLTKYAGDIGRIARATRGAEDVYVEQVTGLQQIVVRFKREDMARFGVSIEAANRALRTAFAGEVAGVLYEGEKKFDVVVRLEQAARQRVEDVRNLLVATPDGGAVPLGQLADVQLELSPNQIQRDAAKRRITVAFNVRGRDVESIVEEIKRSVQASVRLPSGYSVSYGGSFQNLVEAKQRLAVAVPAALALIFVLLYFTVGSVRQAALIFVAVPLAAVGGVAAMWLRGMPFSISAGVGFIALFGVAVLNGIVLLGAFNRLKAQGVTDVGERIRRGVAERLRPVLMTALVASLGFLPMAVASSSGAEVQKPLATVVIGGLLSATALTLVVLPVLYAWEERSNEG
jgi:cobalt-zinc-cadmium resistance protein CzcA